MKLHKKALYNLIRYSSLEDKSFKDYEDWQVENLRDLSKKEIFNKISQLKINIDRDHFMLFSHSSDSPEELTDYLTDHLDNTKKYDQIYLLIFELWRRFVPEKQSLSIFCDELDYRIYLYDKNLLDSDEAIQDALANFLDILEEHVDNGLDPKEVFLSLKEYLAHDSEKFLFDYILEQIDFDNILYAQELYDGFVKYVSNEMWFKLLHARLISLENVFKANEIIKETISYTEASNDLEFLFITLELLTKFGDKKVFLEVLNKTLSFIHSETHFQYLLQITANYFHKIDKEDVEKAVINIMEKRSKNKKKFNISDDDIKGLTSFFR